MATIVLGAVGAFVGSGFGGTVLGLSGAVIGRAIGATLGRAIDQRLLGAGSEPVSVGRLDRLRMMASGQGLALPLVWGKMRVGGAVIWASAFTETASVSGGGGGKGARGRGARKAGVSREMRWAGRPCGVCDTALARESQRRRVTTSRSPQRRSV